MVTARALVDELAEALARRERASWVMVIGRRGSLPMSRRAKMLVLEDGRARGTVGGGCLEAEAYARGRQLLASGGAAVDTYHLVEVEEGIEGHVCGGTVTLLTLGLDAGAAHWLERLRRALQRRRPAVFVATVPRVGERQATAQRWLVDEGGVVAESHRALPDAVLEAAYSSLRRGGVELREDGGIRYWIEAFTPSPQAFVFGAGHCGVAIGRLAAGTGFDVVMLDDRPELLGRQRTPWAAGRVAVDLSRPLASIRVPRGAYAVIVTRGHEHDLHVLRALLDRPLSYLGMIGSRRKRALFERRLRQEGVSAERLAALRSPMGLAIGADTPEEIAVSVVAEMVAVRRGVARETPAGAGAKR